MVAIDDSTPEAEEVRTVTMKMVADRCGVSAMTVSRAFRHDPRVAAQTAERIQAVAAELGYNPAHNQMARQMALRKHGLTPLNHVIAIFFPPLFYRESAGSYYGPIYDGIMTVAMLERFALLTNYISYPNSETDPIPYTPINALPHIFSHGEVDGVIMLGHPDDQRLVARLLRREVNFHARPIISLIEPAAGCDSVLTDDYTGAYAAASHLLDLGHRHMIHFCNERNDYDCRLRRLAAYRQALHDRGLEPSRHLHYCGWDWDHWQESAVNFSRWMDDLPQATAILAHHDYMATILADTLQKKGMRIPDDMSIIGHDDCMALADERGQNILTTVRLPLSAIGQEAARRLINRITGKRAEEENLVLPVEFIVRASTAPPAR